METSNPLLKNTRPPTQEICGGRLFIERPEGATVKLPKGAHKGGGSAVKRISDRT